ncbi:MAG: amidohydrolase [Pseudomonadales bacterium]
MKKITTTALFLTFVSAVSLLLAACTAQTPNASISADPADIVLTNGAIYRGASQAGQNDWVDTIAIKGKRINFLGNAKSAKRYIGANTQVIDLKGRMAMPGLIDAHLHPLDGALANLYRCKFPFTATPEMVQKTVAQCVKSAGDRQWIIGGRWDSDFFINNNIESPRRFLDEVSADKAVFLRADSGHDGWANSKGLSLAGISRDSLDPEGGTIVRDANGEPNGVLMEKASYEVVDQLPLPTQEEYLNAARELMRIANGYGVTGMKDASADLIDLKTLHGLAKLEQLTSHMATAITVNKTDWAEGQFDIGRFTKLRTEYQAKNVNTEFIKIFMDGVPTSSRTAAMLDDYLPAEDGGKTHAGDTHYTQAQLSDMLAAMDKAGFTVKIHTAGDRSVRMALNAIESTRELNGQIGLRHELAHAGYIAPSDIARFAQLNAVADLSPYLWHPSPIIDSIVNAVGPRALQYWPIKALMAADAPLLVGSDWPSAVASMNPWLGMEAMVSRADPGGGPINDNSATLWPEQAITVQQAISIYTTRGALALKLDDSIGSLSVGKLADIIVLDQNLFEVSTDKIGDTQVMATWFEGRLVHATEAWSAEQ